MSIATTSPAQAASGTVWDRVAACESGGNWKIATGNGYYGGLQFSSSSWRAAGGARYAALPHHASRAQQIAVAQNLLRMQGPGAWPLCSRKAGLNRSNGLAAGGGLAVAEASRATVRYGAVGRASRMHVRDMQSWLGHARTGRWTVSTTKSLQAKVRATKTGRVNAQTVRLAERAVGARLTGAPYFTKASMNKLMRYAAARA